MKCAISVGMVKGENFTMCSNINFPLIVYKLKLLYYFMQKMARYVSGYLPTRPFSKYDPIGVVICPFHKLHTSEIFPVPHGL